MRIKSTYLVTKKFQYKLFIKDMLTGKTLYVLDKDEANIKSNDILRKAFHMLFPILILHIALKIGLC